MCRAVVASLVSARMNSRSYRARSSGRASDFPPATSRRVAGTPAASARAARASGPCGTPPDRPIASVTPTTLQRWVSERALDPVLTQSQVAQPAYRIRMSRAGKAPQPGCREQALAGSCSSSSLVMHAGSLPTGGVILQDVSAEVFGPPVARRAAPRLASLSCGRWPSMPARRISPRN